MNIEQQISVLRCTRFGCLVVLIRVTQRDAANAFRHRIHTAECLASYTKQDLQSNFQKRAVILGAHERFTATRKEDRETHGRKKEIRVRDPGIFVRDAFSKETSYLHICRILPRVRNFPAAGEKNGTWKIPRRIITNCSTRTSSLTLTPSHPIKPIVNLLNLFQNFARIPLHRSSK